jgi:transcriptional regulator with XRE-family HTH domain
MVFRMSQSKRKSNTVQQKLNLIEEFKASGLSGRKFAALKGINESMVRKWVQNEVKFRELPITRIRKARKVQRERKGSWPEIDAKLLEWVLARNSKGLRVKDKFIQMQARNIRDEIVAAIDDGKYKEDLKNFIASKIYVHRFKTRNSLRSRRHTMTHSLPDHFREQAVDFIENFHRKCSEFNIPRERIINFDQVREFF